MHQRSTEQPFHTLQFQHAYQRHGECKSPGIDEEVLSAHLDDVEKARCNGSHNDLGHQEHLDLVLDEEPYCLQHKNKMVVVKTSHWH